MRTWVRYLLAIGLMLAPLPAMALEPEPGDENFISRAVYTEGQLWLLSDSGQLFSVTEKDRKSRQEDAGAPIIDMCRLDGHLVALTGAADKAETWTVRRRDNGKWIDQAHISGADSGFAALVCADHSVILMTGRSLITIRDGAVTQITIQGRLQAGILTVLGTSDSLYVGANLGEWGGGLEVIDRATGQVHEINKNDTGGLCGGPLNGGCDPVNGLAIVPWKPDCLALAIGLVHMAAHGRITEACPDDIRTLYSKQFGERYPNKNMPESEAYQTMAFFGLTAAGDHLVALGLDGIYTLSADGKVKFETMPHFSKVGPFRISFARHDMILVKTVVNGRWSMSGPTPLMVQR